MRHRSGWARLVPAFVAIVLGVGATAACGGDDKATDGNVTLRFDWWGNADRAALTEQVVDLFEKRHPNITIQTSFAEFGAYFQKLATQVAGGSSPDLMQMDYRYVREYADRGVLAEFGAGGVNVDTSQINPGLLAGGKINGKLYAIPLGQNTQTFTYDPAQWTAAGAAAPKDGWTWADLTAAAQKVTDKTGGKVRGISDFGPIEDWFEVWLRQQGKTLYTDAGQQGYTAEDVAKWWTLADGLRRSKAATAAEVTAKIDGSQANDPVSKKTASSGFGYDSGLTPKTWEIMGREMAISAFPSDSAELGQYAKPSMQITIAKRSAHPAEAAQFIDFFINDPEAGKILGLSRGMPVNAAVRDATGATLTGPPLVGYQFEKSILPRLKDAPPPPPKGAGAVKTAFQRVYDDVMFGRATPQAAATRFMEESKQALAA